MSTKAQVDPDQIGHGDLEFVFVVIGIRFVAYGIYHLAVWLWSLL